MRPKILLFPQRALAAPNLIQSREILAKAFADAKGEAALANCGGISELGSAAG